MYMRYIHHEKQRMLVITRLQFRLRNFVNSLRKSKFYPGSLESVVQPL